MRFSGRTFYSYLLFSSLLYLWTSDASALNYGKGIGQQLHNAQKAANKMHSSSSWKGKCNPGEGQWKQSGGGPSCCPGHVRSGQTTCKKVKGHERPKTRLTVKCPRGTKRKTIRKKDYCLVNFKLKSGYGKCRNRKVAIAKQLGGAPRCCPGYSVAGITSCKKSKKKYAKADLSGYECPRGSRKNKRVTKDKCVRDIGTKNLRIKNYCKRGKKLLGPDRKIWGSYSLKLSSKHIGKLSCFPWK